ncbi:preprotein translocase subunit SecY [Clostridium frigidicarnis]|uniref:Protein translocase subunit SecY n=1 Tax=Clostridium frigidicarnis TaxID=84698 RepID=A0A1I0Z6N7_9CLOT|nr:preprotein translocase subunit SecY [Clostridium frigidicarnis]SFB19933.1 protein translocase subunit secY/sec61 alpha [Clostridium frigidicarnis]
MLSTLRNAWKVKDLRKRILYTIFLVAIFRIGNFIPVPGIDASKLQNLNQEGSLLNFYDLMAGGAFSRFSIFALAVGPYINASIIMQLLTMAIPSLEQLSKEGEEGRKKIQNITRYLAIPLSIFMAYGSYALINSGSGAVRNPSPMSALLVIVPLVAATTFLTWLADQITVKGIGNGVSLIIFVNIISRFPTLVYQITGMKDVDVVAVALLVVISLLLLLSVIIMTLSERRIPVQYAGKAIGNKNYSGQSTHIPIGMNGSAVIAIIFALSVMQFPPTIAQFFPGSGFANWVNTSTFSIFKQNTIIYIVAYAILVIFFTWFYSQVTFKPEEMAENMHKSAGFIPGIRPGDPTARFIEKVLDRISVLGGSYAAIIAVFPIILSTYTPFTGFQFGGTMLLILVSVSLDTMRQIESQLVMRHYQGFLK